MEKEYIFGMIIEDIKEIGKIIKWMERALLYGQVKIIKFINKKY